MAGPLNGVRIIEFSGLGPGPYAAMLLGDMGAEIVRIDRLPAPGVAPPALPPPVLRGRRSICLDLTMPEGLDVARRLVASADALIEGYRPGKMEKLGLGPEPCLQLNPRLIYGRITGWGQTGPMAHAPGHDINYIALAGVLGLIGRRGAPPSVPLNLVGDYGGGALFLALGLVCALFEARASGQGQVIDAAMIDGAASMITSFHHMQASGRWSEERGTNHLDSGAPYYDVYETADGRWISLGAIEPQFYRELRDQLALHDALWDDQADRARWPARRDALAAIFRTRTRQAWCDQLEGTSVCFAPVLGLAELADHPHHQARDAFIVRDGVTHPAPAPRFSRTPSALGVAARPPGADTSALLAELGLGADEIDRLTTTGSINASAQAPGASPGSEGKPDVQAG